MRVRDERPVIEMGVYIPVGMYSRILSSVVQPVEQGETTGRTTRILGNPVLCRNTRTAFECVRGASRTIYLAFSLSCDLGEMVVE